MNTTSNRGGRGFAAGVAAVALALGALLASGCSDNGPINMFSQELFHRSVNGPNLVFYAANSVSFTTQAPVNGCNVCYSGPMNGDVLNGLSLIVTVANSGGAGTYGPIVATFSSTDPDVVFEGNSPNGNWVNATAPPPSNLYPAGCNCGTAVSGNGAGYLIAGFDQTAVVLYQGYDNNGDLVDDNQNQSVAFYYLPNCTGGGYDNQTITVPITLKMVDGFNNQYVNVFDVYIIQSSGTNAQASTLPNTPPCP